MRSLLQAGMLLFLFVLSVAVAAQPDVAPQPPPARDAGFNIVGLMRNTNDALAKLAQGTLASERLAKVTGEGLIVAPFAVIPEDAGMDLAFILAWTQERMTTAMIKHDEAGHFEVVDRIKIDKAMKELKLDAKALQDPQQWPALGKAAGAQYLLTGSISVVPAAEKPATLAISISARIVAIDTCRAIAGDSVDYLFINQPEAPPAK